MILAGFILGLMGSVHCIGMCGPIAMALPVVNQSYFSRTAGVLLYNLGRTLMYALLGLLFGFVGKAFVITGYQQLLSIALGLGILAMVVLPATYTQHISLLRFTAPLVSKVKTALGNLFGRRSYPALFFIGVLNGLLPCGMVYAGIAGAIATGNPLSGSLFMALFGLGTLPAMMAVSIVGQVAKIEWKSKLRKTSMAFAIVLGLVFVLRGMNLGVPYLSPQFSKTDCTVHSCCHKK